MIEITCARKAILALALVALVVTAAPAPQGVAAPAEDALSIRVHLQTFEIVNADEDGLVSNGDEPYLFVVVVLADGTTINVNDLANARVRQYTRDTNNAHGNLGLNHVGASDCRHAIPEAIGLYDATIRPIRGLAGDQARQLSQVAVLVIAMEEDGTPARAANRARQALHDNLKRELDAAVQAMSSPDIAQLTDRIREKMTEAATSGTLSMWWAPIAFIAGLVDPDDFIGTEFRLYTYAQIELRGHAFTMNFRKSGVHYRLRGIVRPRG